MSTFAARGHRAGRVLVICTATAGVSFLAARLNHDGRVDYRDAQVILDAAEKVEHAHWGLL